MSLWRRLCSCFSRLHYFAITFIINKNDSKMQRTTKSRIKTMKQRAHLSIKIAFYVVFVVAPRITVYSVQSFCYFEQIKVHKKMSKRTKELALSAMKQIFDSIESFRRTKNAWANFLAGCNGNQSNIDWKFVCNKNQWFFTIFSLFIDHHFYSILSRLIWLPFKTIEMLQFDLFAIVNG